MRNENIARNDFEEFNKLSTKIYFLIKRNFGQVGHELINSHSLIIK
jgi:hypothetical protein